MSWSRAFTATLAEYDSELYRWWEEHQSTDISALTTEAEEALAQCIMALTELRTLTDRHCPYCGSSSTQLVTSRRATEYQCHDCGRRYNNLTKTPLANLHHIELWTDYVPLLVAGYHDNEIGERLNLSAALAGLWRPRFLQILQARWPLLAHWSIWQCSRRRVSQSRNI